MNKKHKTLGALAVCVVALAGLALPTQAQAYGGDYCREYTRTVIIGNRHEEAYGTACLRDNGDWEIVNESRRQPVNYSPVIYEKPSRVIYRSQRPIAVRFYGGPYQHRSSYKKYVRHNDYHHGKRHYKGRHNDRDNHRGHR